MFGRLTISSLAVATILLLAYVDSRGPPRPSMDNSNQATTTAAIEESTEAAGAETQAVDDDEYVALVKGYIDAGTCSSAEASTLCGDSATSYYREFEYNGQKVVISSGVPDHTAETDALKPNPNTRCEIWQFMALPINPGKAENPTDTSMGVISLTTTGGTLYNQLSSPDGSVALYNEGISLDSCMGHSDQNGQYHYHANLLCDEAGAATGANDPDQCVLVGWARDGVPVYGYCKDSSGTQFTSCYALSATATSSTVSTVAGDFESAENISSYEYDQDAFDTGSCNLDEGLGAIHPTTGQYSYFLTTGYPWVPVYYFGDGGVSSLCSAA